MATTLRSSACGIRASRVTRSRRCAPVRSARTYTRRPRSGFATDSDPAFAASPLKRRIAARWIGDAPPIRSFSTACATPATTVGISIPRHLVAREHLAHALDQRALLHGELRLGLLLAILIAVLAQARELGAEREILDLHLALLFLVAALDHHAGRAALVGVFHLRAEFSRSKIKLGPDVGGAQLLDHLLILADPVLIEHRHHHRPRRSLGVDFADQLQSRHQPRHADREAG